MNCKLKIICIIFSLLVAYCLKIRFVFQASTILNFGIEKCPFCFNESCEIINDVKVKINFLEFVISFLNPKYVFLGFYKNKSIVIKRLASKEDDSRLDSQINVLFNNVIPSKFTFSNLKMNFYAKSLTLLNQSFMEPSYKLRLCPTLQNVQLLFNSVRKDNYSNYLFVYIWTSLLLNPEPLLLQIFKYEDGWPVPKYFGSCGRTAVVENCGKTIETYMDSSWILRVHIVEQLLWMAHKFTFYSPLFSLYFRDISSVNVVVDSEMKTRIIDLEHVIIVDKSIPEKDQPPTWNLQHKSENYYCDDCIVYSPLKICNHHISDHNFYVICKEFLHSVYPKDFGLLHSAPKLNNSTTIIYKMRFYIEECIHPSKENNRIKIAEDLRKLLNELKLIYNFSVKDFK